MWGDGGGGERVVIRGGYGVVGVKKACVVLACGEWTRGGGGKASMVFAKHSMVAVELSSMVQR